jgi:hypothetical protein
MAAAKLKAHEASFAVSWDTDDVDDDDELAALLGRDGAVSTMVNE